MSFAERRSRRATIHPFFTVSSDSYKVTESATVYRRDYRPFSHSIDSVELDFVLDPESTLVTSKMKVTPRRESEESDLVLNARNLKFESLEIDGVAAAADRFRLTDTTLTVFGIRHQTTLTIVNRFSPAKNTDLSGIYMSHGAFMSQCEAEGFRAITYWPDRPDVMSYFTVTIHADKTLYPVLLSNGNLSDHGEEADGRHWARWEDPSKKPCYLFALVAGAFENRSEKVTLKNGHECLLQVWTEEKNYDKSAWALTSLKKAIFWDEERFGLELDLKRFMIVATDDFNFGAMENKGLNIFNSRYVMATPTTATDDDYAKIESVVGHEYFHNWTGDRVTLRDWFQLTLKEGLTVFRDQEFSMDVAPDESSRAVKRINDVRYLRAMQFPEDAGPMSHPIRPDSYREINNFYTMTVYEKGAEVVRMLQTIFGREGFRRGLDLYIERHDGSAVTCDDFIRAMAQANNADLSQFARWWSQSGTPRVTAETIYDENAHTFTMRVRQATPATADQKEKLPLVIPLAVGLLDHTGKDLDLVLADAPEAAPEKTKTLILRDEADEWVFVNVPENPVLSLGRGFSAPVIFDYPYTREELAFLAGHDSDPFNRAEAFERLALDCLGEMIDAAEIGDDRPVPDAWLDTFRAVLVDESLSPSYRAAVLEMPSERTIAQTRTMINPDTIRRVRLAAQASLGSHHSVELSAQVLKNFTPGAYEPDARQAGKRALKNMALDYWLAGGNPKALLTARDQFENSDNLTDQLAALKMIVNSQSPAKLDVLNAAAGLWYQDPLLMNKWFTVQACAIASPGETPVVDRVRALMDSTNVFSITNPNNVYALVNAFMTNNLAEFHRADGSGYQFWVEMVTKLDAVNTHVAGRLARALDDWRRFEPQRAKLMHRALVHVAGMKTLSPGVKEIIDKALNFR